MGDVGGLLDGLRYVGIIIMNSYTFLVGNPLNAFLVNSLFKREKKGATPKPEMETIKSRSSFSMLLCTCLRSKKEKRILAKGIARTESMLEIDHFIRMQMQV